MWYIYYMLILSFSTKPHHTRCVHYYFSQLLRTFLSSFYKPLSYHSNKSWNKHIYGITFRHLKSINDDRNWRRSALYNSINKGTHIICETKLMFLSNLWKKGNIFCKVSQNLFQRRLGIAFLSRISAMSCMVFSFNCWRKSSLSI